MSNSKFTRKTPSEYRYTITCKLTWDQHSSIQELASEYGKTMTNMVRELIDSGIETWLNNKTMGKLNPLLRLISDIRKARKQMEIREALRTLRWELSPEDFHNRCRDFGEDPKTYEDVPRPEQFTTKRDHCLAFLRILFTDRPEGLSGKRVLEIAKREGFGKNLTQDGASELNIEKVQATINGRRMSIWKPSENSNFPTSQ